MIDVLSLFSFAFGQGFAAGPEAILKAMDTASSTANLQPNGVAQAVALRLLRYCEFASSQTRVRSRFQANLKVCKCRGYSRVHRAQ